MLSHKAACGIIRGSGVTLAPDVIRERLLKQWPRFLWRAILVRNGSPIFEMLFDATDMALGALPLEEIFYYDLAFRSSLQPVFDPANYAPNSATLTPAFY